MLAIISEIWWFATIIRVKKIIYFVNDAADPFVMNVYKHLNKRINTWIAKERVFMMTIIKLKHYIGVFPAISIIFSRSFSMRKRFILMLIQV